MVIVRVRTLSFRSSVKAGTINLHFTWESPRSDIATFTSSTLMKEMVVDHPTVTRRIVRVSKLVVHHILGKFQNLERNV